MNCKTQIINSKYLWQALTKLELVFIKVNIYNQKSIKYLKKYNETLTRTIKLIGLSHFLHCLSGI